MNGQATRAVFLSYASQDAAAAQLMCEALQAAGIEVWFDQSTLRGGDAWDAEIRRRIKECALFVPIISANTELRPEGYFRLEWHLAEQRMRQIVRGKPFLLPVVIDGTPEQGALVPESFTDIQWTRLIGGEGSATFAGRIHGLLQPATASAHGRAMPVDQTAGSALAIQTPAGPMPRAAARPVARRMGRAGIAALAVLLLAIGGAALWRLQSGGASRAPTRAVAAAVDRSFAVLPFVNLSGDPAQEFFSDGLTEEITSALARIRDLKVVGRTSAFEFKGKNQDLRAIGQALGARFLLEGSVRKAGDQLRVTAQLINAADGVHLWTESYDRKLTDVFAIQEEIATAIAGALRVPLGLSPGERLVSNRTTDVEAYQDFLRAKALFYSTAFGSTDETIRILERVVSRTPDFAPAWAVLSRAYVVAPGRTIAGRSGSFEKARRGRAARLQRADEAAQRALALDPALPDAYIALGRMHAVRGDFLAAEAALDKALALDPNEPLALGNQAGNVLTTGQLDRALALSRRALELEPVAPNFIQNVSSGLWLVGDTNAAISLTRNLPVNNEGRPRLVAIFLASQGRFREAAAALHEIPAETFLPGVVAEAERLLRSAPTPVASLERLPKLGLLSFVYLYAGAPNRVLEYAEDGIDAGYSLPHLIVHLWHPSYAPVRKTERFKALVRRVGLIDYWRARGWPKFCQPAGADDFTCS